VPDASLSADRRPFQTNKRCQGDLGPIPQNVRIALYKALARPWTKNWGCKNVSNNTLQWTADEPDPQRGYCGHHAYARVGNYAISPSVSFGSLIRYRVSYMPTGTVMESRTIGHYRSLKEAKAAAQRDHDKNRDQGR
jgi:hypothetical protein